MIFLNYREQTGAELATLGKEMQNLRTEIQEHRIKALVGTSRPIDPNQERRQNGIQVCNYCSSNRHTLNWRRQKILDKGPKLVENERTAEKTTSTQDFNGKRGPSHWSVEWNRHSNLAYQTNLSLGQDNQNRGPENDWRPKKVPNRKDENRPSKGKYNNQNRTWWKAGNFSRSPSGQGQDFSQGYSFRQHQPTQPNSSIFRRPDHQLTSSSSYEQWILQNKYQTKANEVWVVTTVDRVIDSSDFCPLNCWGPRIPTQTNLEPQGSASTSFKSAPETSKKTKVWKLILQYIHELFVEHSLTDCLRILSAPALINSSENYQNYWKPSQDKQYFWSVTLWEVSVLTQLETLCFLWWCGILS